MLTLQRASAGSGKTYTLTKKFIRLLLSVVDNGRTRLRTDAELHDAISHILAITFTNKATAEMKERIISRLDNLAYGIDPAHPEKTDYLIDLMKEFNVGHEEISRVCRIALRSLLYNFSDFNVQTIDSFFQAILRTFAYESDLPDSYELIIDGKYVNKQAVASMVEGMADRTLHREPLHWIKTMIRDDIGSGRKNWNVFSRKEESSGKSEATFSKICRMAEDLDKESNKKAADALARYFDGGHSLLDDFKAIDDYYSADLEIAFGHLREAAACVLDEFGRISPGPTELYIAGKVSTARRLENMIAHNALPDDEHKWNAKEWTPSNIHASGLRKAEKDAIEQNASRCVDVMTALNDRYAEWQEAHRRISGLWTILAEGFPRMGLIHELRSRIDGMLRESGAIKLSSTNSLLRSIIADDDVPFIYERFGTRLNHFLIDEFQDTSLLQWENIRPLLRESESHDHENLIIGDAKQSIYRFRSADPTLITRRVPEAFANRDERGYLLQENANRRSSRHIVEFNNFIFRSLSRRLGEETSALYSNTVQLPANRKEEGYVEVNFYAKDSAREKEADDGSKRKIPTAVARRLGPMISEMLSRGYRQREIAVLVNSNNAGSEVIKALMEYNRNLPAGARRLEFVSEESLTLSSSDAVNTVVGCLRMIQSGIEGKFSEPDPNVRDTRINWPDVAAHFQYYSMQHPGVRLQERLENFFAGDLEGDVMSLILSEMHAVTLPSLIEALTEAFVPEDVRKEQAVFLAAFQDAVIDYCELYPTDIASLLRWWERYGARSCISSPAGTDAVSVMTIHKSKGLEFECVILPEFNFTFDVNNEWVWVRVPDAFPLPDRIPEFVPIRMHPDPKNPKFGQQKWKDTPFADVYGELLRLTVVDQLNKAYVAMTRPISELYVFLPAPGKKDDDNVSCIMHDILANAVGYGGEISPEEKEMTADPSRIGMNIVETTNPDTPDSSDDSDSPDNSDSPKEEIFYYGERLSGVAEALASRRLKSESKAEQRALTDYFVNSDRPLLHYHEEGVKGFIDEADDDRVDPRSEGSLLHAVLEFVEKESDLSRAFERLRLRGILSREDIERYRPFLEKALQSVRDLHWFDGTCRILAERPLVSPNKLMHRPDRVMMAPDGRLVVIDYKFGSSEKRSAHQRQVANYMRRLRKATGAPAVEGYVWYVKEDRIEPVSN